MQLLVYIALAASFAVLDWFYGSEVGPTGSIGNFSEFESECDGFGGTGA